MPGQLALASSVPASWHDMGRFGATRLLVSLEGKDIGMMWLAITALAPF